jgi:hypothetical protein
MKGGCNKMPNGRDGMLKAKALYHLFLMEAAITPPLQDVLEYALREEACREEVFEAAWKIAAAWLLLHHELMNIPAVG